MARARARSVALTVGTDGSLPSEFRIFSAGWNETSKGRFLFDAEAARAVMAAYEEHGADLMIDLEHLSVEDPRESRNFDPDARGWCKLEVRDGELWAVNVTWTPDGAMRLREKRQRYISPVLDFDTKSRRVHAVFNVAITAVPATHGLEPLVAASRRIKMANEAMDEAKVLEGLGIDGEALKKALGLDAGATLEDLAAALMASADKLGAIAGLAPAPESGTQEGDPAEVPASAAPEDEQQKEMAAARATILRDTGAPTMLQALSTIADWRSSHIKLETERKKLAAERAALEAGERRTLVAEMVKLGSETPATAWADDRATKPAEPWASMQIDALRTRVAKLRAAKGATSSRAPDALAVAEAASGGKSFLIDGETITLSERELRTCAEVKASPEVYAANKLAQEKARNKGAAASR
jgi:hypothetical protein